MNNVCSPETAQEMKAAGFPQPSYQTGQVWYKDGQAWQRMADAYWTELNNGFTHSNPHFRPDCYAATATDILKQLGYNWDLFWDEDIDTFICNYDYVADYSNPNAAEACAPAWLSKNKKAATPEQS